MSDEWYVSVRKARPAVVHSRYEVTPAVLGEVGGVLVSDKLLPFFRRVRIPRSKTPIPYTGFITSCKALPSGRYLYEFTGTPVRRRKHRELKRCTV